MNSFLITKKNTKMTTKHFILNNIPFTQRSVDNFVDITAIFIAKQKIFANYSRIKAAKENFNRYENSVIKSNKHTWCDPRCIKPIIEWLLKPTIIDFSTIQEELDKPFPTDQITEIIKTTKICSKCHEELSLDNFGTNKLKKDNLDVRCKQCYKIDRDKDDKNKHRALDYYEQNKQKSDWNKTNKDQANDTNRRCYEKRKVEEIRKQYEEEPKNIISNITIDKNDQPYAIICRESDGYINVTNLCKTGGRSFSTWHRNSKTKPFLKLLSSKLNMSEEELINIIKTGKNNERSTWTHPLVATNIANWISVEFSVVVSCWIEEWRNTSKINNDKYLKELNNLNPYEKDRQEKDIQLRLQSELKGQIEVKTKFGFIDLLTDTEIIEIKNGKSWKHGLGQLCVYSKFYPDHQKRLHLFNIEKDKDIEKLCEEFNIKITYE
jgi:hypothetical protein